MTRVYVFFSLLILLSSCGGSTTENQGENPTAETEKLKVGTWRLTMDLGGGQTLPFNIQVLENEDNYSVEVINHTEQIRVNDVSIVNDSLFIRMPFFNSEFVAKIESNSLISGKWYNFSKGVDYFIPFQAKHGEEFRFPFSDDGKPTEVAGKWEVTFSPEADYAYKAIGQFEQKGVHLTGTFITETGDYRYLDGVALNDSMFLSCFDGSHAFLFKAAVDSSKQLQGQFWSGKHWNEPWVAARNEEFQLRHPDSLTYLKEGYETFDFTFPNLDSTMVSLSDEKYDGKVVIVQIMGSWCPNCLDETRLYVDLYSEFNTSGLEIVSLAFEMDEEFSKASDDVRRLQKELQAQYDFLIAGTSNKKKASETLPMLNHVMSYPTSIFIDRSGKIRKIHTGFYGPGTGEIYDNYVNDLKGFLQQLLAEESN